MVSIFHVFPFSVSPLVHRGPDGFPWPIIQEKVLPGGASPGSRPFQSNGSYPLKPEDER